MKRVSLGILLFVTAACSSSGTAAVASAPDGAASTPDAAGTDDGATPSDSGADGGAATCGAAIEQTLRPIDKVSTGIVSVVSSAGAVRDVYVNASAGGSSDFANNPYVYVNLETATRVDVTDKTARASTDWDLAFKRYVIFTNDGDAGKGQGGATHSATAFDAVTAADATGLSTESFFDDNCNAKSDAIGGLLTTFSDWYGYDSQTNQLSAKPLTYVIKGGTGKLYKVALQTYYGAPDGGAGMQSGVLVLKVAPL